MPTKVKYYETFGQATAGLLINLVFYRDSHTEIET